MICIYPCSNKPFAIETIKRLGPKHLPIPLMTRAQRYRPAELDLRPFVNVFMNMHPRGKGLRGKPELHELYAACWTLQTEWSRSQYYLNDSRNLLMVQFAAASGFEIVREMTDGWHEIQPLNELFYRSGAVRRNGNQMILTNFGLTVRNYLNAVHRKAEATKAKKKIIQKDKTIQVGNNAVITIKCSDKRLTNQINSILVEALWNRAGDITS